MTPIPPEELTLEALLCPAAGTHLLRQLDKAFARFLMTCDPDMSPILAWLAAVLSRQLGDGHPCLDLTQLDALAKEQNWPATWCTLLTVKERQLLPASPLLANTSGQPIHAPLVQEGSRLYLRRYWCHAKTVTQGILARVNHQQPTSPHLSTQLRQLFPDPARNWQRIACALMTRSHFGIITGGPGTGKTTTVVRLLELLQTLHLNDHGKPLRMKLAAPTGKAAANLNDALHKQLTQLAVDDVVRHNMPGEVVTLHRLLGARPHSCHFRHHAGNPLNLDVLVIDEASMIDLSMMAAVLTALPTTAKLILLGDKDQLASVEAGAVLGDLCAVSDHHHYTPATAQWIANHSGDDISAFVNPAAGPPLDQHIVTLRVSRRFTPDSGIGQLAQMVNAGNEAATLARLQQPGNDLDWLATSNLADVETLAVNGYRDYLQWLYGQRPVNAENGYRDYLQWLYGQRPVNADEKEVTGWITGALAAFNQFRLLCALRHGLYGVDNLNQRIVAALQQKNLLGIDTTSWYEGRPVMVTRNDHVLGLMNGDIGLCLRKPGDHAGRSRLVVAFPASFASGIGTQFRWIPVSRLPRVETAFALTVHKSQGSEYRHTALLLPDTSSAILTRELLYTAITRAKKHFTLCATPETVTMTVARRTRRHSGLTIRLRDPEDHT